MRTMFRSDRPRRTGVLVLAGLLSPFAFSQPNSYEVAGPFGTLPDGRSWGQSSAIDIDSQGHIWVAERCGGGDCIGKTVAPILEFDASGRLMQSFGAGMLVYPHGIFIDRDDNVWVTDARDNNGMGQQVLKFSPQGELLMTLGKAGVAGSSDGEFNQPTDVVTAPNGDIFVADGHVPGYFNSRIVKFTADGKFIKSWGMRGSGPGEFEGAHALAFDSQGRLFVGDRSNNRIQIFDQEGNFIAEWKQFGRPSGIFIDTDDVLYVIDSESTDRVVEWPAPFDFLQKGYGLNPGVARGIRIGSARDGTVTAFIPDTAPTDPPSPSTMGEGVAADANGVVYAAEVVGMGVRRYVRR